MLSRSSSSPDVTLLLDLDGVIRSANLSDSIAPEEMAGWVGQRWAETVTAPGAENVRRMVKDAGAVGAATVGQFRQRFPSGLELPMEYTTVRLGGEAGLLAIGRSLQAVTELQSRLLAEQHAREQEYWKLREVETRYRLLFDAANEPVLLVDAESLDIREANPAAIGTLGLAPGWNFPSEMETPEQPQFRAMLARVREQGRTPGMLVHLGPSREPWIVRASLTAARPGADPASAFLIQLTRAVLPQVPAGQERTSLEELVDAVPDGFVVTDRDGIVRRANHAFLALAQVGAEGSVIGESLGRFLPQPGADLPALLGRLRRQRVVRLFATTLQGALGTESTVEIAASLGGELRAAVAVFLVRDISRRLAAPEAAPATARPAAASPALPRLRDGASLVEAVRGAVAAVERHYILEALEHSAGNRTAAAEMLGVSRQSLHAKINRHRIEIPPAQDGD